MKAAFFAPLQRTAASDPKPDVSVSYPERLLPTEAADGTVKADR